MAKKATRKKKETKMQNSNEDFYMPDTNKQGWGVLSGARTQVKETQDGGTRVITRTPI